MNEYNPNKKTANVVLSDDHAEFMKSVLQDHLAKGADILTQLEVAKPVGYSQRSMSTEQPVYLPENEPIAVQSIEDPPEVQRVGIQQSDGQIIEVDIDKFPANDPIHDLVRPITTNANNEFEFVRLSVRERLPASFTTHTQTLEVKKPRRMLSRKAKILGGAALALGISGGAVAFAVPGVLPGQTIQASLLPGNDSNKDVTSTEEVEPGTQLTARDIAIGDCLDDTGNGKALLQGKVSIDANMKWKIKKIDGGEAILKDVVPNPDDATKNVEKFPKLTVADAVANVAACITPETRDKAIVVDGNIVKINWDEIERQVGIVPGATLPVSDAWDFEPLPGVTDQATVADITASMNNKKESTDVAASIAQASAGTNINKDAALIEKIKKTMQDQLIAEVNARVAGLFAAKKSPVEKVTVEFSGNPKDFVYKGAKPVESPKFSVEDSVSVYNFDVAVKP